MYEAQFEENADKEREKERKKTRNVNKMRNRKQNNFKFMYENITNYQAFIILCTKSWLLNKLYALYVYLFLLFFLMFTVLCSKFGEKNTNKN